MMTMRELFQSLEGLNVVIVGDIEHSRVARSNIHGLLTMGARVGVCGPSTLIPREIDKLGVTVYKSIEEAMSEANVLNVLRIQLERQKQTLFPSLREYRNLFGITRDRLNRAGRDITIMHPGPINRGVELDSDVADGDFSVILDQVTNGVAIRMAVLYLLGGERQKFEGDENAA
jgi:aspartate carbamoyltransferase catalytic subunit